MLINSVDFLFKYGSFFPESPSQAEKWAIDTAILIGQYVESIDTLKPGIEQTIYNQFKAHNSCEEGALLYGKYAVQDYKAGIDTDGENQLMEHLVDSFQSLYLNPKNDTLKQVTALFENTNQWLTLPNNMLVNMKEADALCHVLHTIFTIFQTKLKSINWKVKLLVNTVSNVEELNTKITTLLESIENKSKTLYCDIALAAGMIATKTLQEHLSERFIQIRATNNPNDHQLRQQVDDLIAVNRDISDLIMRRNKKEDFEAKILVTELLLKLEQPKKTRLSLTVKAVYRMVVPETQPINSERQFRFENLRKEYLFSLREKLADTAMEIQDLHVKLSKGNSALIDCLTAASISQLEDVLKAAKDVMIEYKALSELTKETKCPESFVKKYDDCKVWIFNLFTNSHPLKTDTSSMIYEEALKKERGQVFI